MPARAETQTPKGVGLSPLYWWQGGICRWMAGNLSSDSPIHRGAEPTAEPWTGWGEAVTGGITLVAFSCLLGYYGKSFTGWWHTGGLFKCSHLRAWTGKLLVLEKPYLHNKSLELEETWEELGPVKPWCRCLGWRSSPVGGWWEKHPLRENGPSSALSVTELSIIPAVKGAFTGLWPISPGA